MDSDTAREVEFLLHRKAGYIHGAVFGAVSDCSSIAECWLFTDVKIVYGYTFGRGSPGACDCFWLHVPFSSLKLFYEDSGLDYQGNASDDSAFDYFLFSGLVLGNNIWGGGEAARFLASAVAFIFNYACYFSEIYRGGIQSVPVGQEEAGLVLGMTRRQIFFKVTLLQMIKRIVPPMSNEIITLVKDTSLAQVISIQEVIWAGKAFLKSSHGYKGLLWPLFFTGVYYLVFNGGLTLLFGWVEKKLDYFK